jgi:hypothetical protein
VEYITSCDRSEVIPSLEVATGGRSLTLAAWAIFVSAERPANSASAPTPMICPCPSAMWTRDPASTEAPTSECTDSYPGSGRKTGHRPRIITLKTRINPARTSATKNAVNA